MSTETTAAATKAAAKLEDLGRQIADELSGFEPAEVVDRARDLVSDHPLTAAGVALGFGVALGHLLKSALADDPAETYHSGFRDAIRQRSEHLAARAREASSNVASGIREKVDDLPSPREIAHETTSFADNLFSTIASVASRSVLDWLKRR